MTAFAQVDDRSSLRDARGVAEASIQAPRFPPAYDFLPPARFGMAGRKASRQLAATANRR